jgi:hypothetical protein
MFCGATAATELHELVTECDPERAKLLVSAYAPLIAVSATNERLANSVLDAKLELIDVKAASAEKLRDANRALVANAPDIAVSATKLREANSPLVANELLTELIAASELKDRLASSALVAKLAEPIKLPVKVPVMNA